MSERDAVTLTAIAQNSGYEKTADPAEADLIIISTCCVRESAENKIIGKIGELKKLKAKKTGLKIAVAGCMVQQPGQLERLIKRAPHVDIWTGTFDYHKFEDLLEQCAAGQVSLVSEKAGDFLDSPDFPGSPGFPEAVPPAERGKISANVNIMIGCDNYCSYCIVPYVRGRERSRLAGAIIQEITALVANGCKEVTLLGQNVNSYGRKDNLHYDFADLLLEIDQIKGLERIRFMTSHPKDLSDKLIRTVAEGKHICEHFHFPFQAGSNRILQKMNRNYTREYYLERVGQIQKYIPEARLTTDIIVGFPGETEEDFEQTLDLVHKVNFSQAFTFMFSKRSGTGAAGMEDQIPLDVKKKRLQRLMALQDARSLAWRQKMIGKTYEVMLEGPSKTNARQMAGRTRGNEIVVVNTDDAQIGSLVKVAITSANSWTLFGQIGKEERSGS